MEMASRLVLSVYIVILMCVPCATVAERLQVDEESVSLTLAIHGRNTICQLNDVIKVKVTRSKGPDIDLYLRSHDVISASSNQVYVMRQGQLETVSLNQETLAHKSYIDDVKGAALMVKCIPHPEHGSVIKVEGTIHELGRRYRLFPAKTWSQSVVVSDSHVTGNYVMEAVTQAWPRPHTELQSKILANAEPYIQKHQRRDRVGRVRRQSNPSYYIDLLPVVDFKLYQRWQTKMSGSSEDAIKAAIKDYLRQLYASVALRLGTLDVLQRKLVLRMIDPYIADTQAASPIPLSLEEDDSGSKTVRATSVLTAFENWVGQTTSLPVNDHAMLLTGYDIYGTTDTGNHFNITSGLANVATICQGSQSVSLVEDRAAYQSEGVATHELGHSLGSVHDGDNNNCNSADRYIMTDNFNYKHTAASLLNPWKFSSCSATQISNHILTVENNAQLRSCLTTAAGSEVTLHIVQTANKVCQDFYGAESFACRGVGVPGIAEVCDNLFCRKPGTNTCVLMAAPTGTCCGKQKACSLGKCENEEDASSCDLDETCPYGDQPGIVINGLECSQIPSHLCYTEDVEVKCCKTCAERKLRDTGGCSYGDKLSSPCNPALCGASTSTGVKYSFLCCETCADVDCVDNRTLSIDDGTQYSCSDFMTLYGNRQCYRTSVHDVACCDTCERLRDKTRDECMYGDRGDPLSYSIDQCNLILSTNTDCNADEEARCCDTCAKIRARTTQAPPTTQQPQSSTTESGSGGTTGSGGRGTTGSEGGDTTRSGSGNKKNCKGLLCDASVSLRADIAFLICSLMVTLFIKAS